MLRVDVDDEAMAKGFEAEEAKRVWVGFGVEERREEREEEPMVGDGSCECDCDVDACAGGALRLVVAAMRVALMDGRND